VAEYAGKTQSVSEFLMHIIPNTVVDAFSKGDILQVLLVSVLFGFALSAAGPRCKPLLDFFNLLTETVFGVVSILMRFAPIGAFGALAFTIGKYGIASLGPLAKLIGTFYSTSILFVFIVLGVIARVAGFGILRFLAYIKEEILLVLAISSSEPAMPTLMAKLEKLGCSKGLVGLVVPTGYTFNTDARAVHDVGGAVCGAGHKYTADTYTGADDFCRGGADIERRQRRARRGIYRPGGNHDGHPGNSGGGDGADSGIDRFMSMCRATVNMIGNGVATVVVSRWERNCPLRR